MYKKVEKVNKEAMRYYKSINTLYSMFCEMSEMPESLTNVSDKAKILDKYYEEITDNKPKKYMDVRGEILKDYRQYNPKYGKKTEEQRKKYAFSREFVASELAKEGCKLMGSYINCHTYVHYIYKGCRYGVTFGAWRSGYRPHIEGIPCDLKKWLEKRKIEEEND